MANLTVIKHSWDCMRVGGRKQCPGEMNNGCGNPKYYAGCYEYQDTSKGVGVFVSQAEKIAEISK